MLPSELRPQGCCKLLASSLLTESLGPNLDPLAFVRAFVPKIRSGGRALIERGPFIQQSVLCSLAQPVALSAKLSPSAPIIWASLPAIQWSDT